MITKICLKHKVDIPGDSLAKRSFGEILTEIYQISELLKGLGSRDLTSESFIEEVSSLLSGLCVNVSLLKEYFIFDDENFDADFDDSTFNAYRVFLSLK